MFWINGQYRLQNLGSCSGDFSDLNLSLIPSSLEKSKTSIIMSVYYYEPFYNFDRFFDEVLGSRGGGQSQQLHGAEGNAHPDNHSLVKSVKPR